MERLTEPFGLAERDKGGRKGVEVRMLGVGLSYATANALFGGTAEYVALRFKPAASPGPCGT